MLSEGKLCYYTNDRIYRTMFYCIVEKGMKKVTKMSTEKLIKLQFLIILHHQNVVTILPALALLGLEDTGKLLTRLQSDEPIISNKLSNNWEEIEDHALFWA